MRFQRVSKDRRDRRAQPLSSSRVQPISTIRKSRTTEKKDDTRPLRGHATSTLLCARMRPARLLPDYHSSTHHQQQLQRLRQGRKFVSRQTSTGVKSKDIYYRLPLSLSRSVKEATPKSSTTITEEVPRLDWRDLRVQRTASAESTTATTTTTITTTTTTTTTTTATTATVVVQPSRRRRRRRRHNPGALAFPRRCGAVVRSTGVG
ncbi:hypothetical protein ALC62_04552 [Cyphomyrmex costatus]|uniref:Uncharacterized protein n=1 Tax=Cyphomyrmex costatus TaxID=456900 RepID=A0A195CV55_9HYME|nr:hypothetical protein ALC62_04552 [Cyphomyrmex costatus]